MSETAEEIVAEEKITDIKVVDFNTPDPNLVEPKAEEKPAGGENPPAGAEKAPEAITREKHIEDFFTEKTQGKYKNLEEYEKHISEKVKSEFKVPVLSERLKKLAELEEKGVDIDKVLDYQKRGYDKLNPENIKDAKKLIFEKWREADEDITDKELEYRFKKDYSQALKTAEDAEYDEEETEIAKLTLGRQAKKIHQEFLAKQKEMELPKSNPDNAKKLSELKEQWRNETAPLIKSYNEESFKVAEGNEIKFVIDDTKRNRLQEAIIDPNTFILSKCSVKNEDGSIRTDIPKLRRTLAIIDNADEIISSVYGQGVSAGAKAEVERIENLGKGGAGGVAAVNTGDDDPAKVYAERVAKGKL